MDSSVSAAVAPFLYAYETTHNNLHVVVYHRLKCTVAVYKEIYMGFLKSCGVLFVSACLFCAVSAIR